MSTDALGSVLVLGGCGFLGYHIVQRLVEADDVSKVTVFDLQTSSHRVTGADYRTGSITSRDHVLEMLSEVKPQVVFHTVSPQALGGGNLFMNVNVGGTSNLLDCIQQVGGVKALVYTSSSSVVHDNRSDLAGATEDLPLLFLPQQTEMYSHTKAIAEDLVLKANKIGGLRTCSIRPAGMFGEGDRITTENIIGSAREGNHKIQIGDNSKLYDWTYVGNNAYAQLLAARALLRSQTEELPNDKRVDGEAFVITNDDPWPFWDFLNALRTAAGYPVKPEDTWKIPSSLMWVVCVITESLFWIFTFGTKEPRFTRGKLKYMTIHRYFNISKAKSRLGYSPQLSMEEGIQKTAKWYLGLSKEDSKQRGASGKMT